MSLGQRGGPIPRPSESRYGVRHARWIDTGERFGVATIESNPVACEPDDLMLEEYAKRKGLALVSEEMVRDLTRRRS